MQLLVIRNRIRTIFFSYLIECGHNFTTFRISLTKRKFIEYLKQLLPSETVHESMVGGKKFVMPPMLYIFLKHAVGH